MMRTAFGARHSVPTHSVHKQRVLLGLLALLLPATVSLAEWRATYNPYHIDCSAHELRWQGPPSIHRVDLDRNGLVDGTAWEGHRLVFQASGTLADIDCFSDQGSYYDEAETSYAAQWRIYQRTGAGGGDWTEIESNLGTQLAQSEPWVTEDRRAGAQYRAKCFIEDTPQDGPGGDDQFIAITAEFTMVEPFPVALQPTQGTPSGGELRVDYSWMASCGHISHLDDVKVREYVSYSSPVPCFEHPPDPTITAPADYIAGHGGGLTDRHKVLAARNPMPTPPPNGPGNYALLAVQDYQWKHFPPDLEGEPVYPTPDWAATNGGTGLEIYRNLYWVTNPPLGPR